MEKNLIIKIALSILVGYLLCATVYNSSKNSSIAKMVLESEKKIRDSLSKEISILSIKSDSLEVRIDSMYNSFSFNKDQLFGEIKRLKYEIPKIVNYSILSDSALISRLSRN